MAQKCWSNHNLFRSIIITGDHIKLQQLLKSSYFNPNSVDLKDRYGRTPLIFSVLGDHYECTEILLKVNSILRYLLFSFCIEKMAHNNFEEFNFRHFKFKFSTELRIIWALHVKKLQLNTIQVRIQMQKYFKNHFMQEIVYDFNETFVLYNIFYQLHLWKRETKQNLKFNMLSVQVFWHSNVQN